MMMVVVMLWRLRLMRETVGKVNVKMFVRIQIGGQTERCTRARFTARRAEIVHRVVTVMRRTDIKGFPRRKKAKYFALLLLLSFYTYVKSFLLISMKYYQRRNEESVTTLIFFFSPLSLSRKRHIVCYSLQLAGLFALHRAKKIIINVNQRERRGEKLGCVCLSTHLFFIKPRQTS